MPWYPLFELLEELEEHEASGRREPEVDPRGNAVVWITARSGSFAQVPQESRLRSARALPEPTKFRACHSDIFWDGFVSLMLGSVWLGIRASARLVCPQVMASAPTVSGCAAALVQG